MDMLRANIENCGREGERTMADSLFSRLAGVRTWLFRPLVLRYATPEPWARAWHIPVGARFVASSTYLSGFAWQPRRLREQIGGRYRL